MFAVCYSYGRTVGRVYVGGVDVNAEMVKQGAAWVYRKYAQDQALYRLEEQAKERSSSRSRASRQRAAAAYTPGRWLSRGPATFSTVMALAASQSRNAAGSIPSSSAAA